MQGSKKVATLIEAHSPTRWHPQVVLLAAPRGAAAEQYRVLAERLRPAIDSGVRRVAITSTTNGEGRTTTAVNLALALASEKRLRVALVDADLRGAARPTSAPPHALLGLAPRPGLGDVVAGDVDLDAALERVGDDGLCVLQAGHARAPHATYASPRFGETLETCADRFDVLVIDAPPILPTADALALARVVDAMVLVVQAGRAPRELIAHALAQLPPVRVLGAVLHRVEAGLGAAYDLLWRHDRALARESGRAQPHERESRPAGAPLVETA